MLKLFDNVIFDMKPNALDLTYVYIGCVFHQFIFDSCEPVYMPLEYAGLK